MYSIVVWGLIIPKSSHNSPYRLQKECVKLIAKMPKRSSVEPIFESQSIIRFPNLIENELRRLRYKVTNKLLPKPLVELFQQCGGKKMHRYETHKKNTPNIQQHNTHLFNQSFSCKNLSHFNKLPGTESQKNHYPVSIKE